VANTIPPVLIELQLETARISAQMAQIKGQFEQFGQTVTKQNTFMEKFKANAAGMFAGNLMAQGFNMVGSAIRGAIEDAQTYEVLIAKTNAVMKSTGEIAGVSAKDLISQASALEKIAAVDENVILNGENVIATFTNIRNVAGQGNDVFNQTTQAALDLSAALGQDMQSSAIQLGKALNDPVKGVSALQRVGVSFTASQKEMIKSLVASGDTLGAQKIILKEVNTEFGGAAKAAGDTFAGAVFRAKDKVADFTRNLVTELQPILLAIGKTIGELYNKFLAPLFSWLGKNKEAVALFAAIILTAVAAFKLYKITMAAVTAVQELYIVGMALAKGAKLADIAATEGQTGAMVALNAVMNANPLAKVVAVLALLAAGFVVAWNHSETFRKVIVEAMKGAVMGVGYLIKIIGWLAETFLKIESGPLRLFLKGLAFLHVSGAKTALDEINKGIESVGGFFDKAGNAVQDYADKLDGLKNKKITIPGFGGSTKTTTGGKTGGGAAAPDSGLTPEQIKAAKDAAKQRTKDIEAANQDVVKIYDKMNKAIDDGNKKAAEALVTRDKAIVETKAKYAAKEIEITKKKDEELAKNFKEWNKAYTKANEDAAKRNANIEADYLKKQIDLRKAANDKITTAEEDAAKKRASIIQTSIDRLRSAFASGTAASITDIFKNGATSADTMIAELKNKLSGAKELQKNAAALQAAGYSQVFIEDVVKNGAEVGNEMAKALLGASADTQNELKGLYTEINNTSAHGLDEIAKTMNTGGKLATEELLNQFKQVTVDLNDTLAGINKDLLDNLATANEDYKTKLADSTAMLNDALQAADEKLAEANTQTMKDFNEALQENAANLADALAQIQLDYEDTIAKIAQDTKEKLDALSKELDDVIAKLKALGALQAAINAGANSPASTYVPPTSKPITKAEMDADIGDSDNKLRARSVTYNYNVTGVNMSDPNAAAKAIDNTVKFGAPQSINTRQGVLNKLAAMGIE